MKHKILLAASICSLFLMACNETLPWTDSLRFEKANSQIIYQAPKGAAEAIQAAWFPQAVLPLDASRVLFASQGTRRLVELDTAAGTQTVLFDLAAWEPELNHSEAYASDWGEGLIRADSQWLIVASARRALLWVNTRTGEVKRVGNTRFEGASIPEEGLPLRDIDFSLFSGIERSDNGFYLVLGSQVFEVSWDGKSPETLLDGRLELIAGTLGERSEDPHDARGIPLRFSSFTHFAKYKGYLCFWTPPALRAVKDGRIYIITGFGYNSPNGDLESFYAQGLPPAPELVALGDSLYTPYWSDESALLKMRVDSISEEETLGALDVVYPDAGALNQLAAYQDHLLSVDTEAGAFWRIDPESASAQRLFGPESAEARFESLSNDPDSPYEPHAVLTPLSLVTWQKGASALLYSPTVERLSLLSLSSGKVLPFYQGTLQQIVSDQRDRVWFADYQTLYFMNLNSASELELSYVPQFFKKADIMGVPCDRKTFALTETPDICATSRGLYLHVPEAGRILAYDRSSDALTVVHENGWADPETSTQFYKAGMPTRMIEQWVVRDTTEAVVLNKSGRQYVFVGNLSSKSKVLAGRKVEPNQFVAVATDALAGALITALALTPDERLAVSAGGRLMLTDQDGHWQDGPDACRSFGDITPKYLEAYVQNDREQYVVADGLDAWRCTERDGESEGYRKLGASMWRLCGSTVAALENGQLCTFAFGNEQAKKCTKDMAEFDVRSISCDSAYVYLSGADADGASVIKRAPLAEPEKLRNFMGMGAGVADKAALKDARLGYDLGKMSMDDIGQLYFWMRDTCTVWRIKDSKDIAEDSLVYRVLTDDRLCAENGVLAVSPDSELSFASGTKLYIYDGYELLDAGTFAGDVIELEALGNRYVALTSAGIEVWQDGKVSLVVRSPVNLEGKDIQFAVAGDHHPRMVQSPGENAVLVPVYSESAVLKLSLDPAF